MEEYVKFLPLSGERPQLPRSGFGRVRFMCPTEGMIPLPGSVFEMAALHWRGRLTAKAGHPEIFASWTPIFCVPIRTAIP